MRKTMTLIISATALLGATSLAFASPGVSDQSQMNSGATATPHSRTGSQAAPYDNSGSGASTTSSGNATLKSGGTTGSGTSAQVTDQAQVKQQLEQQGYTCAEAEDGLRAVELALRGVDAVVHAAFAPPQASAAGMGGGVHWMPGIAARERRSAAGNST